MLLSGRTLRRERFGGQRDAPCAENASRWIGRLRGFGDMATTADTLRAVQTLYAAYLLEELRYFDVAERVVAPILKLPLSRSDAELAETCEQWLAVQG